MSRLPVIARVVLLAASVLPASAAPADVAPAKKRILLLGDSISIGYTPAVQEALRADAVVVRPTTGPGKAENCEGTTKGEKEVRRWLALEGGGWDVVRYNAIARKVMEEQSVAVDDLYAFALPRLKEIQLPQNVHFKAEGSRLLAAEVVRCVRQAAGLPPVSDVPAPKPEGAGVAPPKAP